MITGSVRWTKRKPVLDILVGASNASANWYETFPDKMHLAPYDFAMSGLTRAGRMTPNKVRRMAPRSMADYDGYQARVRPPATAGA